MHRATIHWIAFALIVCAPGLSLRAARANDAASAVKETAIAKLAAAMQPGAWQEIECQGYDYETLMRGQDILAYCGKAAWDETSQSVLFVGQVHLKGPPVFIRYTAADNTWRRQPTPPWAESLKWFHAYENNAADSARGVFFHHASASHHVYRLDVKKNEWSELPESPGAKGHGTALEYFPEMKALVRVFSGHVHVLRDGEEAWTPLGEKLDMGGLHQFACHSPAAAEVLFGGGNDSQAVYRLSKDGKVRRAADAPVVLGVGRSLNVADPVSGELVVLAKGGKQFAWSPADDTWREVTGDDIAFPAYNGHSVSAAPVKSLGVILYFSSKPQKMKTVLYKHKAK